MAPSYLAHWAGLPRSRERAAPRQAHAGLRELALALAPAVCHPSPARWARRALAPSRPPSRRSARRPSSSLPPRSPSAAAAARASPRMAAVRPHPHTGAQRPEQRRSRCLWRSAELARRDCWAPGRVENSSESCRGMGFAQRSLASSQPCRESYLPREEHAGQHHVRRVAEASAGETHRVSGAACCSVTVRRSRQNLEICRRTGIPGKVSYYNLLTAEAVQEHADACLPPGLAPDSPAALKPRRTRYQALQSTLDRWTEATADARERSLWIHRELARAGAEGRSVERSTFQVAAYMRHPPQIYTGAARGRTPS